MFKAEAAMKKYGEGYVRYKFKSALEFTTVTFLGSHITVLELSNVIIKERRLDNNLDYELVLTSAKDHQRYDYAFALIPSGSVLLVTRSLKPSSNSGKVRQENKRRRITSKLDEDWRCKIGAPLFYNDNVQSPIDKIESKSVDSKYKTLRETSNNFQSYHDMIQNRISSSGIFHKEIAFRV